MSRRERRSEALCALALLLGGCAAGDPTPCVPPPACTDFPSCDLSQICRSHICEGKEYLCAVSPCGGYAWRSVGTVALSCDDGNPCNTQGKCVGGVCVSAPLLCNTPPAAQCASGSTLRSYLAKGECVQGQCQYPSLDTVCPEGCSSAQCTNQPCLGVVCDKPLASCYVQPGLCVAGQCSYAKLAAGAPCTTIDLCAPVGICDGNGACVATPLKCEAANADGTCINGACSRSCKPGFTDCDTDLVKSPTNGCEVNTTSDSKNCNGCGIICDKPPSSCHVQPGLCAAGQCSYAKRALGEQCTTIDPCAPTGICDGNGACVGVPKCVAPNANGTCVSGVCSWTCKPGFGDCNKDMLKDGCEVNTTGDSSNCSACGLGCGTCKVCSGSTCVPMANGTHVAGMPPSRVCCKGVMVDIARDTANCGGCGLVCAAGKDCEGVGQTTECVYAPLETSGRCRCTTDSQCPLKQNCRTDAPVTGRCSPTSNSQCLANQGRWIPPDPTNADCPRFCYYP